MEPAFGLFGSQFRYLIEGFWHDIPNGFDPRARCLDLAAHDLHACVRSSDGGWFGRQHLSSGHTNS